MYYDLTFALRASLFDSLLITGSPFGQKLPFVCLAPLDSSPSMVFSGGADELHVFLLQFLEPLDGALLSLSHAALFSDDKSAR